LVSALPVFAGLLLFDTTRGMFLGWVRLLFGLSIAAFAVPMILAAELSLLEPWLAQTIEQRSRFIAAPSAPTELLALTGSFQLIVAGTILMIVRACLVAEVGSAARFVKGWQEELTPAFLRATPHAILMAGNSKIPAMSRAQHIAIAFDRRGPPVGQTAAGRSDDSVGRRAAGDWASNVRSASQSGGNARRRQRQSLSHSRRDQR
jgi:hypothetical protein